MGVGVGKYVTKENPKSDLDLDLGFVNSQMAPVRGHWAPLGISERMHIIRVSLRLLLSLLPPHRPNSRSEENQWKPGLL